MVDEFQDTNRLQLDMLEALERDNLFAVGDEFQSIYRFRHADVAIFRERRAKLDAARVRGLRANFRSRRSCWTCSTPPSRPCSASAFAPLVAGRPREAAPPTADDGALRLFDPDPPADAPPVELLVTDTKGWDERAAAPGLAARRRPAVAPRRGPPGRAPAARARSTRGRRAGDIVVLVRATASLRLLEEALEEQGLPTYVVGGRGYWSQEQVRDGLAWLRVLANPHDEEALLTACSPRRSTARTPTSSSCSRGGREAAAGLRQPVGRAPAPGRDRPPACRGMATRRPSFFFCHLLTPSRRRPRPARALRALLRRRARARRAAPLEVLLERAIVATGYDLAMLARPGGDRRLANLRKLMRLAGEYERAEGRDLRGFLDDAGTRTSPRRARARPRSNPRAWTPCG